MAKPDTAISSVPPPLTAAHFELFGGEKKRERGGEQYNKGKPSSFKTVSPIRNTAVIFFKLEAEKLILISHKAFH